MEKRKVLLADDHSLFHEMITLFLEPEWEVVGTAEDGEALLRQASRLMPDVVVTDISMPRMGGIEAAERLRRISPRTRIVFLSAHTEPEIVRRAMATGAFGYLLKTCRPEELRQALRAAGLGVRYLSPEARAALLREPSKESGGRRESLTPRQWEVVRLLAKGNSMKQAAERLHVSPRTVAFHKYGAMDKLDLDSTADLVRFAVQAGMVEMKNGRV